MYQLADAKCKKDMSQIFKETVHKNLASGINKVVHGNVRFDKVDVDGKQRTELEVSADRACGVPMRQQGTSHC